MVSYLSQLSPVYEVWQLNKVTDTFMQQMDVLASWYIHTYIHSIALDRALASITGFLIGICDVGLSAPRSACF
jgi:hypothetical protein